jgi:hypothetical protein
MKNSQVNLIHQYQIEYYDYNTNEKVKEYFFHNSLYLSFFGTAKTQIFTENNERKIWIYLMVSNKETNANVT